MKAILIVDVIHVVSFCWAVSRVPASRNAWRPDYLDYPLGVVAASSWFVVTLYGLQGIDDTVAAAMSTPLSLLLVILVIVVVYVSLIAVSGWIRRVVGERLEVPS